MGAKLPRITERLDAVNDVDASVERAATMLRKGGLVAVPTETVYGLAAPAWDAEAVAAVFRAKGRPADNPLIVHVADVADIDAVAIVDPVSMKLLEAFAPGPLTVVLPRVSGVPLIVTAGLDTVAVRVPDQAVTRAIIRQVGPLAAPSANRSGRPSPTTAAHVLDDMNGIIDAVVDAGPCRQGLESTVVRVSGRAATLLRPGALPARAIEECLGVELRRASLAEGGSPGMRHRHYAPDAAVILFPDASSLLQAMASCRRPYILARPDAPLPVEHCPLTAARLYAELRNADAVLADKILVLCDGPVQADEALLNRLQKAAEGGSIAEHGT